MSDQEAFRSEIRSWLEANCPPEMRQPVRDEGDVYWGGRNAQFKNDAQKAWFEACRDKGYTVPEWPTEYGGAGLSAPEAKILRQEMARINARPPLSSFGIWMLGPALLKFGTEEQKQRMLPPLIQGKERACFGVTEPNAGLDTTNLQTKAEKSGNGYVVHGRKMWTSTGQTANKILLLARTSPRDENGKRAEGLSLFYTDFDRDYIEVREIEKMGRKAVDSNAVFIDGLPIPQDDLIGEELRRQGEVLDVVDVGQMGRRVFPEDLSDLLHERAREAVGVSHLQHAAVQVDLHAHLEVVDAVEAAVRLRHAVPLEEDGALALALPPRSEARRPWERSRAAPARGALSAGTLLSCRPCAQLSLGSWLPRRCSPLLWPARPRCRRACGMPEFSTLGSETCIESSSR